MNCEWKTVNIGDLGAVVTGKTPSTKKTAYWNGSVHFVTPKDLQESKHILHTERTITSDGLEAVRGCIIPAGAVCVSCIGNIGYTSSEIRPRNHHYGLVLFDASNYIASTRLMVIRAIEDKVSPAMLYQYLLLPEVEAEFTAKTESRSGTFPQGNYADMASIQVPYSPTVSQTMVAETLSQIRYTIARNQFESQRLVELRDALLPKLMSGEIDVSAIEI